MVGNTYRYGRASVHIDVDLQPLEWRVWETYLWKAFHMSFPMVPRLHSQVFDFTAEVQYPQTLT